MAVGFLRLAIRLSNRLAGVAITASFAGMESRRHLASLLDGSQILRSMTPHTKRSSTFHELMLGGLEANFLPCDNHTIRHESLRWFITLMSWSWPHIMPTYKCHYSDYDSITMTASLWLLLWPYHSCHVVISHKAHIQMSPQLLWQWLHHYHRLCDHITYAIVTHIMSQSV